MIAWDKLHCRFERCSNPVWGLYSAPQGCVCFGDPVQALCAQHAIKAADNVQEFEPIVERPDELVFPTQREILSAAGQVVEDARVTPEQLTRVYGGGPIGGVGEW